MKVCDVAARLVDQLGNFSLGHALVVRELLIGPRFFDRVEVLALKVLDECESHDLALVEFSDECRNLVQPRSLRSAPAAFAGDDAVTPPAQRRYDDRLNDTPLGDGRREGI